MLQHLHSGCFDPQDHHQRTPLHWAAAGGNESAVAQLLRCGANCHTPDHRGRTPLHYAVVAGASSTAKPRTGAASEGVWTDAKESMAVSDSWLRAGGGSSISDNGWKQTENCGWNFTGDISCKATQNSGHRMTGEATAHVGHQFQEISEADTAVINDPIVDAAIEVSRKQIESNAECQTSSAGVTDIDSRTTMVTSDNVMGNSITTDACTSVVTISTTDNCTTTSTKCGTSVTPTASESLPRVADFGLNQHSSTSLNQRGNNLHHGGCDTFQQQKHTKGATSNYYRSQQMSQQGTAAAVTPDSVSKNSSGSSEAASVACINRLVGAAPTITACQDHNGSTALHVAAETCGTAVVEALLAASAVASARDNLYRTPLHAAAARGAVVVGRRLVQCGAEVEAVDHFGATPLHYAAFHNHVDFVLLLCQESGGSVGSGVLEWAAATAADESIAILVGQCGASLLDTNKAGARWCPALHVGARHGHVSTVALLLSLSRLPSSRDHRGVAPLHLASYGGHVSCVKLLLRDGASLQQRDNEGRCALHYAALAGHQHLSHLLLQAGCAVDACDYYGRSSLHVAASQGHLALLCLLLENCASHNLRDNQGCSALHLAAIAGAAAMVGALLEVGAFPNYTATITPPLQPPPGGPLPPSTPSVGVTPLDCVRSGSDGGRSAVLVTTLVAAGAVTVEVLRNIAATILQRAWRRRRQRCCNGVKLGAHTSDGRSGSYDDDFGKVEVDSNAGIALPALPHMQAPSDNGTKTQLRNSLCAVAASSAAQSTARSLSQPTAQQQRISMDQQVSVITRSTNMQQLKCNASQQDGASNWNKTRILNSQDKELTKTQSGQLVNKLDNQTSPLFNGSQNNIDEKDINYMLCCEQIQEHVNKEEINLSSIQTVIGQSKGNANAGFSISEHSNNRRLTVDSYDDTVDFLLQKLLIGGRHSNNKDTTSEYSTKVAFNWMQPCKCQKTINTNLINENNWTTNKATRQDGSEAAHEKNKNSDNVTLTTVNLESRSSFDTAAIKPNTYSVQGVSDAPLCAFTHAATIYSSPDSHSINNIALPSGADPVAGTRMDHGAKLATLTLGGAIKPTVSLIANSAPEMSRVTRSIPTAASVATSVCAVPPTPRSVSPPQSTGGGVTEEKLRTTLASPPPVRSSALEAAERKQRAERWRSRLRGLRVVELSGASIVVQRSSFQTATSNISLHNTPRAPTAPTPTPSTLLPLPTGITTSTTSTPLNPITPTTPTNTITSITQTTAFTPTTPISLITSITPTTSITPNTSITPTTSITPIIPITPTIPTSPTTSTSPNTFTPHIITTITAVSNTVITTTITTATKNTTITKTTSTNSVSIGNSTITNTNTIGVAITSRSAAHTGPNIAPKDNYFITYIDL